MVGYCPASAPCACVAGAVPQQRLQNGLKRGRVEHVVQGTDRRAGVQADGPKIGGQLAGGRLAKDGILDLGWHPHAAPGCTDDSNLYAKAVAWVIEVSRDFTFVFANNCEVGSCLRADERVEWIITIGKHHVFI